MIATEMRPECLRPFAYWNKPTGAEVRLMIQQAGGLSGAELAQHLGLTGKGAGRRVRAWVSEDAIIPYSIWCMLAADAGYGLIWQK